MTKRTPCSKPIITPNPLKGSNTPDIGNLIINTKNSVEVITKVRKLFNSPTRIPSTGINIIGYYHKQIALGNKLLMRIQTENDLKRKYIDIDSLEIVDLRIKGTNEEITELKNEIEILGQKVYVAEINGKEIVLVNPETLEIVKFYVKGTNLPIIGINTEVTIGTITVKIAQINENRREFINPETLEMVKFYVKGTKKEIVSGEKENFNIGEITIQKVTLINGNKIWINIENLEEVILKIKGTKHKVKGIGEQINIGKLEILEVDIGNLNKLFVERNSLAPLKYKGKYVRNLMKTNDNKILFCLSENGYAKQDWYEFNI